MNETVSSSIAFPILQEFKTHLREHFFWCTPSHVASHPILRLPKHLDRVSLCGPWLSIQFRQYRYCSIQSYVPETGPRRVGEFTCAIDLEIVCQSCRGLLLIDMLLDVQSRARSDLPRLLHAQVGHRLRFETSILIRVAAGMYDRLQMKAYLKLILA